VQCSDAHCSFELVHNSAQYCSSSYFFSPCCGTAAQLTPYGVVAQIAALKTFEFNLTSIHRDVLSFDTTELRCTRGLGSGTTLSKTMV
jgi:hypothetical protein